MIHVIRAGKIWFQKTRRFFKCCFVDNALVPDGTVAKAVVTTSLDSSWSPMRVIAQLACRFLYPHVGGFASVTVTTGANSRGGTQRNQPWRASHLTLGGPQGLALSPTVAFRVRSPPASGAADPPTSQAKTLRIRELRELSQVLTCWVATRKFEIPWAAHTRDLCDVSVGSTCRGHEFGVSCFHCVRSAHVSYCFK